MRHRVDEPSADRETDDDLRAFANDLVRETLARVDAIDQLLVAHAHNWRLERMAVIDRLVLRLAVGELLAHPETPPKVVINEALELARTFSGDDVGRVRQRGAGCGEESAARILRGRAKLRDCEAGCVCDGGPREH